MAIEVTDIIENEDGLADVQFDVSDEQEVQQLVSEGLNFLLIKGFLECNTEELLRWAELGKQEEKTGRIFRLKEFLETLGDEPQPPEVIDKICGIVYGRTDLDV